MSSDQKASVIRRKAQSGLQDHQARAMSVQKALRVTLAKTADDLFDMAMSALGVTCETRDADACADLFDPDALLILLDGPARKTGAAVVDAALAGALIQQQTMGTVTELVQGADPRKLTETDAAMCAPFLDELLTRAARLPETEAERALLEGYRFGARAEDKRLLQMALDEPDYRVLRLTIDIAGGRRQGKLDLFLPLVQAQTAPNDGPAGSTTDQAGSTETPKLLMQTVMSLNAELTVALTKMRLPLSRITALGVGDTLPLGISGFDKALVLSADGKQVSSGVLGQSGGARALRVDAPRPKGQVPQRRAQDRSGLNLPDVAPLMGTAQDDAPQRGLPDRAADTAPGLPDLPDLPDMSDLPELSGMDELPDLPDLPDLSDLPDLPDLPDIDLKAG